MGKAVRGAGWTILTGIGSRSVGLVGSLVLTHYLAPAVQGEVMNAFIVVLFAHQFSSFGAQQYLVANRTAGSAVTWNVLVFQTIIGLVFFGATVVFRDSFGVIFNAPTMGKFVPGMALALFFERMGMVPERLLVRQLQFRRIGLGRTVGELAYTGVSVGLAALGWGGMAIVWGNICRCCLNFTVLVAGVDRAEWLTPAKLSRETMRPVLRYSLPLWIGAFATFATRRGDNLIVSWLFGANTAGVYNQAYNFADVPAVTVGEQIGDVLFPSFTQMDAETRKAALLRSTGLLAIVVFPLAVGLGAVTPSLVAALLGKEWAGVAPMLIILSGLSVSRPVGWTVQAYLQGSNRPRATMWLSIAKIVFLFGSLVSIGQLTRNPLWACGAVGLAFGLHSLASVWTVSRLDGIAMPKFLGRLLPPLLACVPMALAVVGVRHALAQMGLHSATVSLVLELMVGALTYVVSALVVARELSKDFINLVMNAIRRRGGDAGGPPSSD